MSEDVLFVGGNGVDLGIGAAVDVELIDRSVRAYIDGGSDVDTRGNVSVEAVSSEELVSSAAGKSLGSKTVIGPTGQPEEVPTKLAVAGAVSKASINRTPPAARSGSVAVGTPSRRAPKARALAGESLKARSRARSWHPVP